MTLAPEHLELMVSDPITVLEKIRNAEPSAWGLYPAQLSVITPLE